MSFPERREKFMEQIDNGIALFRNPPEGDTRYHPDCEVLSSDIPITVEEIEQFMSQE